MAKRYMPANGTEGDRFESVWCERCTRGASVREAVSDDACSIWMAAILGDSPEEWQTDGKREWCVAFDPATSDVGKGFRAALSVHASFCNDFDCAICERDASIPGPAGKE
jgi:hypothetical protein